MLVWQSFEVRKTASEAVSVSVLFEIKGKAYIPSLLGVIHCLARTSFCAIEKR